MAKAKLYNVLQELKEVADRVLNEVFVGSSWDVDQIERNYPLMVIDNTAKSHVYNQGVLTLNLDLYIVDIMNQKRQEDLDDYIVQIQNDTSMLGIDFINFFEDNSAYTFTIQKTNDLIAGGNGTAFNHFTEKWADEVAGTKFDLIVRIPDDGDPCINVFYVPFEHTLKWATDIVFACTATNDTIYYSADETLLVGSMLYEDINLSILTNAYYSDGTTVYTINDSQVTTISDC